MRSAVPLLGILLDEAIVNLDFGRAHLLMYSISRFIGLNRTFEFRVLMPLDFESIFWIPNVW